jgi:hypothetical protein
MLLCPCEVSQSVKLSLSMGTFGYLVRISSAGKPGIRIREGAFLDYNGQLSRRDFDMTRVFRGGGVAGCDARREEVSWLLHGNDEQRSSTPENLKTIMQFMLVQGMQMPSLLGMGRCSLVRILFINNGVFPQL